MQTLRGSEEDLLAVAGRLAESGKPRPKLYAWCGTEDPLVYQDHPGACAELKRLGSVSYTHLDVYKRQHRGGALSHGQRRGRSHFL